MILIVGVFCCVAFISFSAAADEERSECLGRLTFKAPWSFDWATYNIERGRIDESGGHSFSRKIAAAGEILRYDYDGLIVKVSHIVGREQLEFSRGAIYFGVESYNKELQKDLQLEKKWLLRLERESGSVEAIAARKESIQKLEKVIASNRVYEHDLGIPDAYILGGKHKPYEFLLWRNQRVYYFHMDKPAENAAERIKELVANFEPRNLYQIPKGPGVCFPYGFIHDDGITGFRIKNSLRLDSTPNVIMSMIHASPEMQTKPTLGIYTTHFQPGYDNHLWKKTSILQALHFGKRITTLEGWRLDPRPGSGKEDRAWFAMAHVGGLVRPLVAVHMHTFPKGTGGLETLTPAPEEVIPKFLKITESIRDL